MALVGEAGDVGAEGDEPRPPSSDDLSAAAGIGGAAPPGAARCCLESPAADADCHAAGLGGRAVDDHAAARLKIVSHPGHYMNHEAAHLVDARSVEYWASLPGQTRHQAFIFELEQANVVARVEWKDRGDGMGAARLALEARLDEEWQRLSTWDAAQTPVWQMHVMSMSLRSRQWRLTFVCNHGDENHLVVQGVRLVVNLPPSSPAHNVMHSQRITQRLWGDRCFTDVDVVCAGGGGRRFPAHRAVLAAASPVFSDMLLADAAAKCQEVVVDGADDRAVLAALEYIYTGSVAEGATCGMLAMGHRYSIAGLVEYAAPVAFGNLTVENVVQEVRTLRAYADDKQLGPVFEALQHKVHESEQLFRALMRGI